MVSNAVFLCVFTLTPLMIGRLTLRLFSIHNFPTGISTAFPADSPLVWNFQSLWNVMVKEFDHAAFSNPPGSILKVQTEFGWHLIRIEDHEKEATNITVEEFSMRFVNEGQ